jgi:hypothetical protein
MGRHYFSQSYYDLLKEICPPDHYEPQNINQVFRWTFNVNQKQNNFKPQYLKNPSRFIKKEDKQTCMAMGLSFFDNIEGAENRFDELLQQLGNSIMKELGDNISSGYIEESDGLNGDYGVH